MNLVLADQATREKRLAICEACPFRVTHTIPMTKHKIARCAKCGCPLASKTKFARATCPLSKW